MSAIAMEGDEHDFEGEAVVGLGYEVRGIAGGLQEPARFSPVLFHRGEEGYLVLHFTTRSIRHDPADKKEAGGDAVRVHILDVLEGTFVDEQLVLDAVKRQREINDEGRRREEEVKGIYRLGLDGDATTDDPEDGEEPESLVLTRQHIQGVHADGLREACPVCQQEKTEEEAGD